MKNFVVELFLVMLAAYLSVYLPLIHKFCGLVLSFLVVDDPFSSRNLAENDPFSSR